MARLISFAAEDDRIGPDHADAGILVPHGRRARVGRVITVRSTNQILRSGDVDVRGGKTGFISKAGYCLATLLKLPAGRTVAGRRRARRQLEPGPLLGNPSPVGVALRAHAAARPLHSRRLHRQVSRFQLSTRTDATTRRVSFSGIRFVFVSVQRFHCVVDGETSALIAALDGGGVEGQRGDGVDRQQHRAAAVAAVEGLQVAVADVAGVDAVALVAARERRDARCGRCSRSRGT